jgi:hypothetical protein
VAGSAWLVNGVPGGNSIVGPISTIGLYTAPSTVPSNSVQTITAQAAVDPQKSATASVTVTAPTTTLSVVVSPATVEIPAGSSHLFSAIITGTTNVHGTLDRRSSGQLLERGRGTRTLSR